MKNIIHITAGDENWAPTGDDLQGICRAFQEAIYDPETTSIVATCPGVVAKVLSVSKVSELRVISAHISQEVVVDITQADADRPSDPQTQSPKE